jgi:hypothetical protein
MSDNNYRIVILWMLPNGNVRMKTTCLIIGKNQYN